jgi:pyridoxal phosphate enzyme (YggS family)
MSVVQNLQKIEATIPEGVILVAVSKTHSPALILEAYNWGQRHFGENKVQELISKETQLPNDIHWHMIGHLQSNKVKFIAPFVSLVHGVDSLNLLKTIDKEANKVNRTIDCLLQVHIASESTKFGFSEPELLEVLAGQEIWQMENVRVCGLMGMATFTDNEKQIKREFSGLKHFFDHIKKAYVNNMAHFNVLSMGMSDDYLIAIEAGSNLVRVGSAIFGEREYILK